MPENKEITKIVVQQKNISLDSFDVLLETSDKTTIASPYSFTVSKYKNNYQISVEKSFFLSKDIQYINRHNLIFHKDQKQRKKIYDILKKNPDGIFFVNTKETDDGFVFFPIKKGGAKKSLTLKKKPDKSDLENFSHTDVDDAVLKNIEKIDSITQKLSFFKTLEKNGRLYFAFKEEYSKDENFFFLDPLTQNAIIEESLSYVFKAIAEDPSYIDKLAKNIQDRIKEVISPSEIQFLHKIFKSKYPLDTLKTTDINDNFTFSKNMLKEIFDTKRIWRTYGVDPASYSLLKNSSKEHRFLSPVVPIDLYHEKYDEVERHKDFIIGDYENWNNPATAKNEEDYRSIFDSSSSLSYANYLFSTKSLKEENKTDRLEIMRRSPVVLIANNEKEFEKGLSQLIYSIESSQEDNIPLASFIIKKTLPTKQIERIIHETKRKIGAKKGNYGTLITHHEGNTIVMTAPNVYVYEEQYYRSNINKNFKKQTMVKEFEDIDKEILNFLNEKIKDSNTKDHQLEDFYQNGFFVETSFISTKSIYDDSATIKDILSEVRKWPKKAILEQNEYEKMIRFVKNISTQDLLDMMSAGSNISYTDKAFPDIMNIDSTNLYSPKDILENPILWNYYSSVPFLKNMLENIAKKQDIQTPAFSLKTFSFHDMAQNSFLDKEKDLVSKKDFLGIVKYKYYPLIFALKSKEDKLAFAKYWAKTISKDEESYQKNLQKTKRVVANLNSAYLIKKVKTVYNNNKKSIINQDVFTISDENFVDLTEVPMDVYRFYDILQENKIFSIDSMIKEVEPKNKTKIVMVNSLYNFFKNVYDQIITDDLKNIYIEAQKKLGNLAKEQGIPFKELFQEAIKDIALERQTKSSFAKELSLLFEKIGENDFGHPLARSIKENVSRNVKINFPKMISKYFLGFYKFKELNVLLKEYAHLIQNKQKNVQPAIFTEYENITKSTLKEVFGLKEHQVEESINFNVLNYEELKNSELLYWEMRTGKTRTYIALALLNNLFKKSNSLFFIQNKNYDDILQQAYEMFPHIAKDFITIVGNQNTFKNQEITYDMPTPFTKNIFPNIPVKIASYLQNPTDSQESPKEILAKDFVHVYGSFLKDVSQDRKKSQGLIDKKSLFYPIFVNKNAIFGIKEETETKDNRLATYFYLEFLKKERFLPDSKEVAKQIISKLESFFENFNNNIKKAKKNTKAGKIVFVGKNAIENFAGSIPEKSNILDKKTKTAFKKIYSDVNINVSKHTQVDGSDYLQVLNIFLNNLETPKDFKEIAEKERIVIPVYTKQMFETNSVTHFYQQTWTEMEEDMIQLTNKMQDFGKISSYYDIPEKFLEDNKELIKDFSSKLAQLYSNSTLKVLFGRMEQDLKSYIGKNGYTENCLFELQGAFNVDLDKKKTIVTTSLQEDKNLAKWDRELNLALEDFSSKMLADASQKKLSEKDGVKTFVDDLKRTVVERFGTKALCAKTNQSFYKKAISILFSESMKSLRKKYETVFGDDKKSPNFNNKLFETVNLDFKVKKEATKTFLLSPKQKNYTASAFSFKTFKYSIDIEDFKKMLELNPYEFSIVMFKNNTNEALIKNCFYTPVEGKKILYKYPMINPKEQLKMPFVWDFTEKEKRVIKNIMVDEIHKNANMNSATGIKTKAIFDKLRTNKKISLMGGTGTGFINATNYGGQINLFTEQVGKFIQNINKYCLVKVFKNESMEKLYLSMLKNGDFNLEFKNFLKKNIKSIALDLSSFTPDQIYSAAYLIAQKYSADFQQMQQNLIDKKAIKDTPDANFLALVISKILISKKNLSKDIALAEYPEEMLISYINEIYLDKDFVKKAPGFTNPIGFASLFNQLTDTNISIKRTHESINYNVLDMMRLKNNDENTQERFITNNKKNKALLMEALCSGYSSSLFTQEVKKDLLQVFAIVENIIYQNKETFGIKTTEEFHKIFSRRSKTSFDAMINHYENYLNGANIEFRSFDQKKMMKASLELMDIFFDNLEKIKANFASAIMGIKKEFQVALDYKGKKIGANIKTEEFAQISFVYEKNGSTKAAFVKTGYENVGDYAFSLKNGRPYCRTKNSKTFPVIFSKKITYHPKEIVKDSNIPDWVIPDVQFNYNLTNRQEKEILEMLGHSNTTFNILTKHLKNGENLRIATTRNVLTSNAVLLAVMAAYQEKDQNMNCHIVVNLTDSGIKQLVNRIDTSFLEKNGIFLTLSDTSKINEEFNRLRPKINLPKEERKDQIIVVGNYESLAEGFAMEFVDTGIYYGAPQSIAAFIQSVARQIGHEKFSSNFYLFNNGDLGLLGISKTVHFDKILERFADEYGDISDIDPADKNFANLKQKPSFVQDNNMTKYEYLKAYEAYMSGKIEYDENIDLENYWNIYKFDFDVAEEKEIPKMKK